MARKELRGIAGATFDSAFTTTPYVFKKMTYFDQLRRRKASTTRCPQLFLRILYRKGNQSPQLSASSILSGPCSRVERRAGGNYLCLGLNDRLAHIVLDQDRRSVILWRYLYQLNRRELARVVRRQDPVKFE
jgi:hypothetical protein